MALALAAAMALAAGAAGAAASSEVDETCAADGGTGCAAAGGARLAFVRLKVPRALLDSTRQFYTNALQFSAQPPVVAAESLGGEQPRQVARLRLELAPAGSGSSPSSAGVELVSFASEDPSVDFSPYNSSRGDLYWKIGLALHDVDAAVARLEKAFPSCGAGQAAQFLDIGYMAHISDPAGFTVELLQTTFESSPERRAELLRASASDSALLGQGHGVVMGQITTRISNKAESMKFYQEDLGMRLLAIEPVTQYGFDLYFLAFTDELPPQPQNLEAVENREWLYQRPYTTLELTLRQGALRSTGPQEGGLEGIVVQLPAGSDRWKQLQGKTQTYDGRQFIEDPDGLKIFIETY